MIQRYLKHLLTVLCCLTIVSTIRCSNQPVSSRISLSFLGAAETVGGSCFLLQVNEFRLLVDCGSFYAEEGNCDVLQGSIPPIPSDIDAIILTHAHLDHWGRLPQLVLAQDWSGPVYSTEVTRFLMCDSEYGVLANNLGYVSVGEERFVYSIRACSEKRSIKKLCIVHSESGGEYCKWWRKGNERLNHGWSELVTTRSDLSDLGFRLCFECVKGELARIAKVLEPKNYGEVWELAPGLKASFLNAGHIPGSAMVLLEIELDGDSLTVLFSGDLGSGQHPFLRDWVLPDEGVDVLVLESTYGMEERLPFKAELERFYTELQDALGRGSRIVIPAFALDRSQRILYHIGQGKEQGWVDSDTAVFLCGSSVQDYTELYKQLASFTEELRSYSLTDGFAEALPRFSIGGKEGSPYSYTPIRSLETGEDLPAAPCIFIATSADGMYSVSRELICRTLEDGSGEYFLVAYADHLSPAGQLRAIKDLERNTLNIACGSYDVPADRIQTFNCFSGHAERCRLLELVECCHPGAVAFLVHGPKDCCHNLASAIEQEYDIRAEVPVLRATPEEYELKPVANQ